MSGRKFLTAGEPAALPQVPAAQRRFRFCPAPQALIGRHRRAKGSVQRRVLANHGAALHVGPRRISWAWLCGSHQASGSGFGRLGEMNLWLLGCTLLLREAFAMGRTETTVEPPDVRVHVDWGGTDNFLLDIEAWMPSEIEAVTPLVDELMRLIERSHCVPGSERPVKLALREALYNAVIHGNRLDPAKLVEVRCRCEREKGLHVVVKDQGQGFDFKTVPHPRAARNLQAEHGRGILLMRYWMDEVWFEQGGTEVHMRKGTSTYNANERAGRERNKPSLPEEQDCASLLRYSEPISSSWWTGD